LRGRDIVRPANRGRGHFSQHHRATDPESDHDDLPIPRWVITNWPRQVANLVPLLEWLLGGRRAPLARWPTRATGQQSSSVVGC
jgi:hypothetical protein